MLNAKYKIQIERCKMEIEKGKMQTAELNAKFKQVWEGRGVDPLPPHFKVIFSEGFAISFVLQLKRIH